MKTRGCSTGAGWLPAIALSLTTACVGSTPSSGGERASSVTNDLAAAAPAGPVGGKRPWAHRTFGHPRSKGTGYAEFTLCATGKSCANHLAQTTFSAQFTADASSSADAGASCTSTTSGSCQLTTCPYASSSPMGVPAGQLTIGGGSIGSGSITSVPIPTNKFQNFVYSFTQVGSAFAAGDTLTLSGSGGKVPAFTTQSLVAPGSITLTSPTPDARGDYAIATKSSLNVTWTGGTAGETVFVTGAAYGPTSETYFECSWDATAGTGTVPTAMLSPLAGAGGELSWGQQSAPVAFDAGRYTVAYLADAVGSAPARFK